MSKILKVELSLDTFFNFKIAYKQNRLNWGLFSHSEADAGSYCDWRGPTGLAAAIRAAELGLNVTIVEKEDELGGILVQCIHDGFGTKLFRQALSGPEFAERFIEKLESLGVEVYLEAFVKEISGGSPFKMKLVIPKGLKRLESRSVLFATGCMERH